MVLHCATLPVLDNLQWQVMPGFALSVSVSASDPLVVMRYRQWTALYLPEPQPPELQFNLPVCASFSDFLTKLLKHSY
jgi:hypothetical protein